MTLIRIQKPSPSKSSGSNNRRILVCHISAGATSNVSLAPFLQNGANQVSYQISVDNILGECYEYVKIPYSAWAVASFNGVSSNGCICAPGEAVNWTRQQWLNNQGNAISNLAQWLAEESVKLNIPLVALTASQAQGNGRGVCQHRDLGSAGGNHSDCGINFPMDELIARAKGSQPTPAPTIVRSEYMGAIIQNPQSEPVPEYAGSQKKFAISADVGGQGGQPINVRLAFKYSGQAGYQVVNATLTTAQDMIVYSTNGRSSVSMSVAGGKNVGYAFW